MRLIATSTTGDSGRVDAAELVDQSLRQIYAGFDPRDVVATVASSMEDAGVHLSPRQASEYAEAITSRTDYVLTLP